MKHNWRKKDDGIVDESTITICKSCAIGTIFTVQEHFRTLRYKMLGVDLNRGGYIRLQNLDDGTETTVEPEWFWRRSISIE